MILRSAVIRLTSYYLLLVMIISMAFSFVLYRVLVQELDNGLRHQTVFLRTLPLQEIGQFDDGTSLATLQAKQLEDSRDHLLLELFYFNLIILITGGFASYTLARQTLKPIEESMEAQNRFVADASHELRTPLTAMQTEIEVALRSKHLSQAEATTLLQSNLEEVAKLEALCSSLLQLARNNDQATIDAFTVLSPKALLEEASSQLQPLATKKDIKIAIEGESKEVKGDKSSLTQLFVILLDNAIKYSDSKTTVVASLSTQHKGVKIAIKDQGPGIKSSDIPHLFERFFRSDQSRSKEQTQGYGLGLAIAKEIVTMHQGTIDVVSNLGQGTTFTVYLPFKQSGTRFLSGDLK